MIVKGLIALEKWTTGCEKKNQQKTDIKIH